jgi:hypothetical protein
MRSVFSFPRLTAALLCGAALTAPLAAQAASPLPQDQSTLAAEVAPVGEIHLKFGGGAPDGRLDADGVTRTVVELTVTDARGAPVKGRLTAHVSVPGLRLEPVQSVQRLAVANDFTVPRVGVQTLDIVDGRGAFVIVAPSEAVDVTARVDIAGKVAESRLQFQPLLRPILAAGLIEGVIGARGRGANAANPIPILSDGFEQDIRRWQSSFDNGRYSVGGRLAFFAKGGVTNDILLTTAFDSEKSLRQRSFRDMNPEQYYPTMGDSSKRGYEAQSADRLYFRLDRRDSFLLYGDFSTGSPLASSAGLNGSLQSMELGLYSRTMTGLRLHAAQGADYLDAFAMRDSLRQAVEEYRGNGTSGPYAVGNANAVENSERVEVVVRDRNNTSRILSTTELVRNDDYSFEPFSGRILLKAPLSAVDGQLNPTSLRITYEVDTGGRDFWVYGLSGHRALTSWLVLGGSFVRNENTGAPLGVGVSATGASGPHDLRRLSSVNLELSPSAGNRLVVEAAQSEAATLTRDVDGIAARVAWTGEGDLGDGPIASHKWEATGFAGASEKDFTNPSSSFTAGRTEAGGKGSVALDATTRLSATGIYSADAWMGTERGGGLVKIERKLSNRLSIDAGVRYVHQSEGAVLSLSPNSSSLQLPGQGPVFGGSGLNPNGAGFWGTGTGLDPITGQPQNLFNGQPVTTGQTSPAIEALTVRTGLTYRLTEAWSAGAEVGQDQGVNKDPLWFALNTDRTFNAGHVFARAEIPTGRIAAGGNYNLTHSLALYGRWERTNGLASTYSLDNAVRSDALVVGLRNAEANSGQEYSELRLADEAAGQSLESATGLKETYLVNDRLTANVLAERLTIFQGKARGALALGGGLEWMDRLWQASSKLEWRQMDKDPVSTADNSQQSWMSTLSVARKLNADWTLLARNYLLATDDQSIKGSQVQNRLQIGAAVRPHDRNDFDMLVRYENKLQRNSELTALESQSINLASVSANWHPSRPWWMTGRLAGKTVTEVLSGVRDHYDAWLVSGRVIRDLTDHWDVGVTASMLQSSTGQARQYAYGAELGYLVHQNVWLSVGYNVQGFTDRDLSGADYTSRGAYIRMRIKFDEHLVDRFRR